jgi:predicted transcriptional regulator YdeE/ubiquinone/menaquinone biosynthesis C-methylase UbiE
MAKSKMINTNKGLPGKSNAKNCNLTANESYAKKSSQTQEIIKFGITRGPALEIGPGSGCLGLEWLKRTENSSLTGLEISAEMVKLAENNAAEYGFLNERAKYLAYISKTLPFEDNSFEAVFSNNSLHDWSEPTVMFNEIHRVLKPGGRYYISDLRWDMKPMVKCYLKLFNPKELQINLVTSPKKTYSEKEINDILVKTKLSGSRISSKPFQLTITGMKPKIISLKKPIPVIGISTKTTSKRAPNDIAQLSRRYMRENIADTISNKKAPGVFVALIKDYHPAKKTFTYTMGDAVTTLDQIPKGLIGFEVPALSYVVFTVRPNSPRDWPRAIMDMKKYIYECWFPNSHYEKAKIINEFELYDERSKSHKNPEIDIYVAIK